MAKSNNTQAPVENVEEIKVVEAEEVKVEEVKAEETVVEEVKVEEVEVKKEAKTYRALVSFCGIVTMARGEEKVIADEVVVKDLLKAKYIKEVK